MFISKKDALAWFEFFAQLPEGETLTARQREIALATLSQIEMAQLFHLEKLKAQIANLRTVGDRTSFVGDPKRFPQGCYSCLMGTGLSAIRRTNRCNLACPFCYDYGELDNQPPIGAGYWEIGGTRVRLEDIDLMLATCNLPTGVAYVYLEPFMEIQVYEPMIRRLHEAGVYQHMYTNGTLATRENLAMLGEAGLNELRFNLGASNCADTVIQAMKIAKEYIPSVGIETPMTREFYEQFKFKREAILDTGIDFINCAELHLNPNNLGNYLGENMYMYRQGYLSPTFSRELTLMLMRRAAREKWPVVVHDCSNVTKFARGFNHRAKESGWFGASSYGMEFDEIPFEAFLPVLRDPSFAFLIEGPLPPGYRIEDLVL